MIMNIIATTQSIWTTTTDGKRNDKQGRYPILLEGYYHYISYCYTATTRITLLSV